MRRVSTVGLLFEAEDLSKQIWLRKREAYSFPGAQRLQLVTPSRWLAEEAKKSGLLSEHQIEVIPYGIDTESFQPRERRLAREMHGIPSKAKTILFVADSAAERRKGLRVLLEALSGLENSEDYFFVIIGRGVSKEGLGSRFKMIDFLDDEAALSYVYSAADLFVIPSLQDNLPNTTIEALACGIPTIGSNVGGIPEVIRDGRTGLLVPPSDPTALRQAIVSLLAKPERRVSMAEQSRRSRHCSPGAPVDAHSSYSTLPFLKDLGVAPEEWSSQCVVGLITKVAVFAVSSMVKTGGGAKASDRLAGDTAGATGHVGDAAVVAIIEENQAELAAGVCGGEGRAVLGEEPVHGIGVRRAIRVHESEVRDVLWYRQGSTAPIFQTGSPAPAPLL